MMNKIFSSGSVRFEMNSVGSLLLPKDINHMFQMDILLKYIIVPRPAGHNFHYFTCNCYSCYNYNTKSKV